MNFKTASLSFALVLLAGCSASGAQSPAANSAASPTSETPRVLEGSPQSYALSLDLLPDGCEMGDSTERPNSLVLEGRDDGEAYLQASQRIDGYQVQFNCPGNPPLIINVVTTFASFEGAATSLSRPWHAEVWERIDAGDLEQLPSIEGVSDVQVNFKDANGTIGIEFIYRNVYFFLTGTASDGADNFAFFEDLAQHYIQAIKASP